MNKHEPKVHNIIKSSSIFGLPTAAMRSAPEVIVLEFMRHFTYGSVSQKTPQQLLNPNIESYTDKERLVINAFRGQKKTNARLKNSPKEFYYAPAYPQLTKYAWLRGKDPKIIGGFLMSGVISHYLKSIKSDEKRSQVINRLSTKVIDALYGQTKEEIFSLCLGENNLELEDLKNNIQSDLLDSVAKTQLFPGDQSDAMPGVATNDLLCLLELEPYLPRQHWLSMLMCYLRYSIPIWCLSQTRNTCMLVQWIISALKGKTPSQSDIDNALTNRFLKLLPVTRNPTRIIHEHIASYMKSRVQLTCLLNSFLDKYIILV